MKESKVEEIQNEATERRKTEKGGWFQKMDAKARWLFLGVIGFIVWRALSSETFDENMLIIGGIIAAVIYYSTKNKVLSEDYLDLNQVKAVLYQSLREKRFNDYDGYYEIPPEASIEIPGPGGLRWLDGKPWKYEVAYRIIHSNSHAENWSAEQDPYSGKVLRSRKRREGFTGGETGDLKYIVSPELAMEKRYEKHGGALKTGRTRVS